MKILLSFLILFLLNSCQKLPETLEKTDQIKITYFYLPEQRNTFTVTDKKQIAYFLTLLKAIRSKNPIPVTPRGGCPFSGKLDFISKGQTVLTAQFSTTHTNPALDNRSCQQILFKLDQDRYDGDLSYGVGMLLDEKYHELKKEK